MGHSSSLEMALDTSLQIVCKFLLAFYSSYGGHSLVLSCVVSEILNTDYLYRDDLLRQGISE